uniref:DUF4178 domain-containing protein n=1 Tax=Solibacter usitatus (strain Ellin6076) TaxID=234267 RepID=Q025E7_SOLUE
MITFIVVAILGALLAIVLMNLFKKDPKPLPVPVRPVEDLANLKVTDARTGDVLSIVGAGDRMTDLDFTADRGARLDAGSRSWVELSGPYQERRVSLRVGGDEEIEVFLHADPRKITLEDLGLSEDDLAQMDERQNPTDNFEFDNATWMYRISREVQAWRDNQAAPTGFYYWEFLTQDGKRLMGIRKAEGEPFTVTLYTAVNPGDVTVYRKN